MFFCFCFLSAGTVLQQAFQYMVHFESWGTSALAWLLTQLL